MCVTIKDNEAIQQEGAVYLFDNVLLIFENIFTNFENNVAWKQGGALYMSYGVSVSFTQYSTVTFSNNRAILSGGAVYSFTNCTINFGHNSITTFYNSISRFYGGAIYVHERVKVSFTGNSTVEFINNIATKGGAALYSNDYCKTTFTGYSKVTFANNSATQYGGALYCDSHSDVTLQENVLVEFVNNKADNGGAVSVVLSRIAFLHNSTTRFVNNTATENGGAIVVLQSTIKFIGNVSVRFVKNFAENGGAVSVVHSEIAFSKHSTIIFMLNTATENGGGIYLGDIFTAVLHNSYITFAHNTADHHGGAIYAELTQNIQDKIIINTTNIYLTNNTALIGPDVYLDIPSSCDANCLNNSIIGFIKGSLIHSQLVEYIKTPPSKLEFYNIATCIDYDNDTNCKVYLTQNVMLGQEIVIDACVLDYYGKSAGGTLFSVTGENLDHHITGAKDVLVSSTVFQGIGIIGKKISDMKNFTMTITSHDGSISDLKTISIKLITELSPCHPGFHYDNTTQRCVCYSNGDIVSCSGSTSSIKRGYWFGEVDQKMTVTVCPNSYCNFSCCEITNGYYKLSPMRVNQCNSHRSGTACGSCEEGYTLSFDSVECVSVDKCTTGQTILVVTISMIYWIVIVVLVFIITYYHVGIGYLYAIAYYYSMLDILLSETLYTTQGMFIAASIMSSVAKVTPRFLGQHCLAQNINGIDQEFIHYVHPLAVTIILAIICTLARISRRISTFVSRGIIHVICFLLLLSYTSVATTSLLLLRSLTFHNVDKIYTYLSPDIEYFHGRHLPYIIITLLFTLVIVIGLPLLLLLEPFLNHKVNFTKIKPLLDQFQGCYKDKYRSFAAYYMTCRLVNILVIVSNPSNNNTTQYLLVIINAVLVSTHVILRPYATNILNVFDFFILQLIIVVSMIPLIDSFDPDLLLASIFILLIMPLLAFLIMEMHVYRNTIKKISKYFVPQKPDATNDNNEIPMRDFVDSVIDDSRRRNATICEM